MADISEKIEGVGGLATVSGNRKSSGRERKEKKSVKQGSGGDTVSISREARERMAVEGDGTTGAPPEK